MYRDEKIRLGVIGNIGARVERNKNVRFACINHLYIGAVLLHQITEGECHLKVYILFFRETTHCSCIMSAMTWIDYQNKVFIGPSSGATNEQKSDCEQYVS